MENKKRKENFVSAPIFNMEFKKRFKSLSIWTFILGALLIMVIAMYPLIGDMYADILDRFSESMPGLMESIMVVPENIAEYYTVEGGQMYILVSVLYSVMIAINIMREDLQNENAEFLYSKPVSKRQVFRTKFLVVVCNILLFNIVLSSISLVTMSIVDGGFNFNIGNFFIYSAILTLIALAVSTIFFSLTALLKRSVTISIGIGVSMLFYVLFIIKDLHENLEFLKYFTPYSLLSGETIADGLAVISLPVFIIWAVVPITLFIPSYVMFKDADVL